MHRFMIVALALRELFLPATPPEEAAHASVVEPSATPFSELRDVDRACLALAARELGELVQRVRPVVPVDEVEIGVAEWSATAPHVFGYCMPWMMAP